ncbi:hypothetical protein LQ327_03355 [Actinomycetospora endophytica]|uniref:DUF559 domain-containing protein n=1 Tax=Actinomycetospora endophytica TaxID=2291215 RepID=A0ABS8P320_9PSEU|nr:hypothetical protein [Actinomycetospora endophytica]MCD2192433.1 hypothetical protein [Actinomycetospora endophytica]
MAHDTYVASAVPDSTFLAIRTAAEWGGPSAVVTGWSACRWWGCEVLPRPEPPVEIAVTDRRQSPPPGCRVRRAPVRDADVVERDGLRVSTPLRAAYDLARLAGREDAVIAADALARVGRFDGAELERFAVALGTARGCRNVPTVARLLDPRSESPMETRIRLVVLRAGFPPPVSQHEVWDGPWLVARLDLAWPAWKVALEYDGQDHALEDRRGRDVERIDELTALGWVVITVTARQYFRTPRWIERRVREELTARGAQL